MTQPSDPQLPESDLPTTSIGFAAWLFQKGGFAIIGYMFAAFAGFACWKIYDRMLTVMETTTSSMTKLTAQIDEGHTHLDDMRSTVKSITDTQQDIRSGVTELKSGVSRIESGINTILTNHKPQSN